METRLVSSVIGRQCCHYIFFDLLLFCFKGQSTEGVVSIGFLIILPRHWQSVQLYKPYMKMNKSGTLMQVVLISNLISTIPPTEPPQSQKLTFQMDIILDTFSWRKEVH